MKKRAYKVTVQEALAKGARNLGTIPNSLSLFSYAILIPSTLALLSRNTVGILPHLMLFIAIALQIAAVIWRGRHSADWKIWALENVQDVHWLYQIAIRKRMIYQRDSWMNIFEVMNDEKQQRLNALEKRLDEPRHLEGPSKDWEANSHEIYYKNDGPDWWHGHTAPIQLNQQSLTIRQNPPIPWEHITNIQIYEGIKDEDPEGLLIIDTDIEPRRITLQIRHLQIKNDAIEQLLYDYWAMAKGQKFEPPSKASSEIGVPPMGINNPSETPTPTLLQEPTTIPSLSTKPFAWAVYT